MIDIEILNDEERIAAWLEEAKLPIGTVVYLAFRGAMRVSANFWNSAPPLNMDDEWSPRATVALRALLTCGVLADQLSEGEPSRYIGRAARHALYYATQRDFACGVALGAARNAYLAFRRSDETRVSLALQDMRVGTSAIMWKSAFDGNLSCQSQLVDCEIAEDRKDFYRVTLYPPKKRTGRKSKWRNPLEDVLTGYESFGGRFVHPGWKDAGPDWQFWHDWFRSVIDGKPMDRDLLMDIVLIDDDIWQAGDEVVNRTIRQKYFRDLRVPRLSPAGGDSDAGPLDLADVTEEYELEVWLLEQRLQMGALAYLAFRAAMRLAPRYLRDAPPRNIDNRFRLRATPFLRALLLSGYVANKLNKGKLGKGKQRDDESSTSVGFLGVDVKCLATEVATATASSAFALVAASRKTQDVAAILAAGDACRQVATVVFASAAAERSWVTTHTDCRLAEDAEDLSKVPLFFDLSDADRQDVIPWEHQEILDGMLDAGPEWQFWHDWYRAVLNAERMDAKLLKSILWMDDKDVWRAGDRVVNREVQRHYDLWRSR